MDKETLLTITYDELKKLFDRYNPTENLPNSIDYEIVNNILVVKAIWGTDEYFNHTISATINDIRVVNIIISNEMTEYDGFSTIGYYDSYIRIGNIVANLLFNRYCRQTNTSLRDYTNDMFISHSTIPVWGGISTDYWDGSDETYDDWGNK